MSVKVVSLVWEKAHLSGSELLCLLAMADWCDDNGGSLYPSVRAIAAKIRTSESQAQRILRKLQERGYIAVVGNHAGGSPGTTRLYRLNIDLLKKDGSHGCDGSHPCARRVASMRETGRMGATQTVNEPSEEPSYTPPYPPKGEGVVAAASSDGGMARSCGGPSRRAGQQAEPEGFAEFWAAYPRKVARQDALRAFAKIRPNAALLERMLAALERHKASRQWQRDGGQYIPYPATWLNGRRWEDGGEEQAAPRYGGPPPGQKVGRWTPTGTDLSTADWHAWDWSKGVPRYIDGVWAVWPDEYEREGRIV